MENTGNPPVESALEFEPGRAGAVLWNLGAAPLIEKAIERHEGILAGNGALVVRTGQFTGRSPKDKFIVREPGVETEIDWGPVNQPMSAESFDLLYRRMLKFWERQPDIFVEDCLGGADPAFQLPIRIVAQRAWHSLFVRQLLVREAHSAPHRPRFTIYFAPGFTADPDCEGTRSGTCIAISFERRIAIIAGTEYAGEAKKTVFTILNYLLPDRGVLPMHCAANLGAGGRVALFFGLSGTGKTTLSADPERRLIGDDEHGWSANGVFNFEGGCYAKCIHLSASREPQIWNAIRFGAVLENVAIDPVERTLDFDSNELTENTRAAYPIDSIANAVLPGLGGHPTHIVFLTADAFGVLPPIARLSADQAMYHFLSGYTAKLAGTERGLGAKPEATFSACFGAPFLPRPALVYAKMLGEKIQRHNVKCYLVNTGWVGGPFGTGRRMDLAHTRAMVNAAVNGELDEAPVTPDPFFGVGVPATCPGAPSQVLNAREQWTDRDAYDRAARRLNELFQKNFARFGAAGEELAGLAIAALD